MPVELNLLILCAIGGLLFILGLHALRTANLRSFYLELAALIAYIIFLNITFGFPFPSRISAKGSEAGLAFYTALYVSVLMGMASQFAFRHFSQPRESRVPWDWGLFIAPLFAAPAIFGPLVAALQSSGVDFNDSRPRLMVIVVAFQNGFFWKDAFEHKRKEEKRKR